MAYVVADVSKDPSAQDRVGVSNASRERVLALRCERAGFLGSLNTTIRFGYVTEVLRCEEPWIVGALYNIGSFGDGFAFWTLLDDGTVITTDRYNAKWPLRLRLARFFPIHPPSSRFFARWHDGTPAEVLEQHKAYVRDATIGSAKPVVDDALRLYAAVRIRSGETMDRRSKAFVRLHRHVLNALMLGPLVPWLAWILWTRDVRAMLLVAGPSVIISFIVAAYFAPRVAWMIARRNSETSAPDPKDLLARATRIRVCNFDEIN